MPGDDSSRHTLQMGTVLATGLFTIGAALLARRSVAARKYVPSTFDANHIVPKFNLTKDAIQAMVDATMLSTGMFGFAVASTVWVMDLRSVEDFGHKMKRRMGGAEHERELLKMEDEEVTTSIKNWLDKR